MKSLALIPTYNEAENIRAIVEAVMAATDGDFHVLVIDDGSPDGTGQIADTLALEFAPRVHVLHREKKMGLGAAYVNGFKWGCARPEYTHFVQMDADFSHHPRYLPKMIEVMKRAPVVIGSRYVQGGGTLNWGIGRKILSRAGSIYSRLILGAPYRDFTAGFMGWEKNAILAMELDTLRSDGYSFQIELKYRAFLKNLTVEEFPIIFEDRKVGQSKMSQRIVIEALKRVWSFRLNRRKFLTNSVEAH
jgi:dolichol-phosphate mannosyltransferase